MGNPTMQAYRLLEWGAGGRFAEVEVPQPGPHDVLVKMAAVGLCHSDITKTCERLGSVLQRLLSGSAAVGVSHIVMARLSPAHRGHTDETYQEETVDETWHSSAPFFRL